MQLFPLWPRMNINMSVSEHECVYWLCRVKWWDIHSSQCISSSATLSSTWYKNTRMFKKNEPSKWLEICEDKFPSAFIYFSNSPVTFLVKVAAALCAVLLVALRLVKAVGGARPHLRILGKDANFEENFTDSNDRNVCFCESNLRRNSAAHALAGAGFILWTFMHDCNGTTTRMKQRPDFCMSDAISILELLQETGEEGMRRGGRLLKANVYEALMTSLLVAFIRDQTHKMTFNQQNFDCVSKAFLCVAVNVQATTCRQPRSPLTRDTNKGSLFCYSFESTYSPRLVSQKKEAEEEGKKRFRWDQEQLE